MPVKEMSTSSIGKCSRRMSSPHISLIRFETHTTKRLSAMLMLSRCVILFERKESSSTAAKLTSLLCTKSISLVLLHSKKGCLPGSLFVCLFSHILIESMFAKEGKKLAKKDNPTLTYKQGMSGTELSNYVKAIAIPIGVFLLALIITSNFGAFGTNIVAPAASVMWLAGAVVAWKAPSQRKSTLKETYIAVAGYVAGLFVLKALIGIAAQTSSEQLMASFDQVMPVSTSSTISGFLQSMLWILAFITPVTYLGMMGKKFVQFRRSLSKDKVLQQIRGIRQ